jgi:hypothetical protein
MLEGTPGAMKVACTVLDWGKGRDNINPLPIVMSFPKTLYIA